MTGRKKAKCSQGKMSRRLTEGFGQQVLDELGVISDVQHAVDAGVHQLFLLVAQILADVLRDKHYVALHVDHEEEAVQGLRGEVEVGGKRRRREGVKRRKGKDRSGGKCR